MSIAGGRHSFGLQEQSACELDCALRERAERITSEEIKIRSEWDKILRDRGDLEKLHTTVAIHEEQLKAMSATLAAETIDLDSEKRKFFQMQLRSRESMEYERRANARILDIRDVELRKRETILGEQPEGYVHEGDDEGASSDSSSASSRQWR